MAFNRKFKPVFGWDGRAMIARPGSPDNMMGYRPPQGKKKGLQQSLSPGLDYHPLDGEMDHPTPRYPGNSRRRATPFDGQGRTLARRSK